MNNYNMVVSSYNKTLQPDYTQLTVLLLRQMYMSETSSLAPFFICKLSHLRLQIYVSCFL